MSEKKPIRNYIDKDSHFVEFWNENIMKKFDKLYGLQNPNEKKPIEDILRELFDEETYFRMEIVWTQDKGEIVFSTNPHDGNSARISHIHKDPIVALRACYKDVNKLREELKDLKKRE